MCRSSSFCCISGETQIAIKNEKQIWFSILLREYWFMYRYSVKAGFERLHPLSISEETVTVQGTEMCL